MANIDTLNSKLSAIGDAIREKTGDSELLSLDDMPDAIEGISGGGGDWTDDDIRTFIVNGITYQKIYSKDYINLDKITTFGSTAYTFLQDSNVKIDANNLYSLTGSNANLAKQFHLPNISELLSLCYIGGWSTNENLSNETLEVLDSRQAQFQVSGINNIKKLAMPYFQNTTSGRCIHGTGIGPTDYYWVEESMSALGGSSSGVGTKVKNLILTRSTMVSMTSAPGSYMPNDNTVEHIFVPKTLLEDYKGATNWSTYSEGKIVAIEDSEALLKGVFDGLDVIYDWWDGDPLIKKLIRMKLTQEWTITFNELVTIADDLRINGENSIYWKYKFFPVMNKGLLIEQGKYLFVTDVFKYEDSNGDKIPFSCLLCGREEFVKDDETTNLSPFSTPYAMNATNTNEGGFYASNMKHILNDSDGALYLEIPSVIRNVAKDFRIDLNDDTKTVKFSILSNGELGISGFSNFDWESEKYCNLKLWYNKYSKTNRNDQKLSNLIRIQYPIFFSTANKNNSTQFLGVGSYSSISFYYSSFDASVPHYVVPTFGI